MNQESLPLMVSRGILGRLAVGCIAGRTSLTLSLAFPSAPTGPDNNTEYIAYKTKVDWDDMLTNR